MFFRARRVARSIDGESVRFRRAYSAACRGPPPLRGSGLSWWATRLHYARLNGWDSRWSPMRRLRGLFLFVQRLRVAGKQAAIACDVSIVLGERLAEKVTAAIVRDEVEIVRSRGSERGAQRCFSGVGDWAGRQARISVSVVRRIDLQILGVHHFY